MFIIIIIIIKIMSMAIIIRRVMIHDATIRYHMPGHASNMFMNSENVYRYTGRRFGLVKYRCIVTPLINIMNYIRICVCFVFYR